MDSASSLEIELQELLREPENAAADRAQHAFDLAVGEFDTRIVLYGAGNLGRKALRGLRTLGLEPLAFSDNNRTLWGKSVDGLEVVPPAEAARKFGRSAAVIITIWGGAKEPLADRIRVLSELGCERVLSFGLLFWKYPKVFLPHYAFDLPQKVLTQRSEVDRAFGLWSDEASRREFVAQVRWRLTLDFDGLPPPVSHDTYLPPDLYSLHAHEVFVDCGAYDGDTIAAVLRATDGRFERIIAFEPDNLSFARCQRYLETIPVALRERIELHPHALGARSGFVSFSHTGTPASSVSERASPSPENVPCVTLDEVLDGQHPTFIKMDIEGAEADALEGASDTIERKIPILAVCSYHQQDHLWRIPLLIRERSSDYRFFLRPHLLEVWDLVCYAVPVNRLLQT